MDAIIAHFKEYYIAYVVGLAALLPIIYVTRRYSVPAILYTVEVAIYLGLMHCIVGAIVRLAAWFKEQSAMEQAYDRAPQAAPTWTTPFLRFWDYQAYVPQWVLYFEGVCALLIVYAVWRYRPLRIHRGRKQRGFANEPVKSRSRPPGAGGNRSPRRSPTGRGRRR